MIKLMSFINFATYIKIEGYHLLFVKIQDTYNLASSKNWAPDGTLML